MNGKSARNLSLWFDHSLGRLGQARPIKGASIHHIVYTSTAVEDFFYADIKHLMLGARRRNRALGVSGILVFHDRTLLQALEGEQRTVNGIFARIASDYRHQNIEILHRGPGFDQRPFGEWSMGFADFTGAADMLKAFVCINERLLIRELEGARAIELLAARQRRRGQDRRRLLEL